MDAQAVLQIQHRPVSSNMCKRTFEGLPKRSRVTHSDGFHSQTRSTNDFFQSQHVCMFKHSKRTTEHANAMSVTPSHIQLLQGRCFHAYPSLSTHPAADMSLVYHTGDFTAQRLAPRPVRFTSRSGGLVNGGERGGVETQPISPMFQSQTRKHSKREQVCSMPRALGIHPTYPLRSCAWTLQTDITD